MLRRFAYLDRLCAGSDLTPTDCFVWTCAAIRAIKLLPCIDVDGIVCAVSLTDTGKSAQVRVEREQSETHKEHAVCDLVLADAAAEDDHARFRRVQAHVVQPPDVGYNVDDERCFSLVGVAPEHVAEGAVGERWAKDGYVVLHTYVSRY